MLLISLIGEQPIPNLLSIRAINPEENLLVYSSRTQHVAQRLRGFISGGKQSLAADLQVNAFDFEENRLKLGQRLGQRKDVIFNLTGGTKIMAMAAYSIASERNLPFVYYENDKSTFLQYQFDRETPTLAETRRLPNLFSLPDYLNLYLGGYHLTGFSLAEDGLLDSGGLFEKAIYDALAERLGAQNVLSGVRPFGLDKQIEIDLVIKVGNQVGVIEAKLGAKEGPKKGLDQLKMATEPVFLGTYTAQFLITGATRLIQEIQTLAHGRNITIICLPEYRQGKPLPVVAVERLEKAIRTRLGS